MPTIYSTAASIDGYISDTSGRIDWLTDPTLQRDRRMREAAEFVDTVGVVVMGHTTYVWTRRTVDIAMMTRYRGWVLTRRSVPETPGYETYAGDVRHLYPRLVEAAGDKNIWIVGGGDVAGQFAEAGLLDEVHVQYAPVTLGGGTPLLAARVSLDLQAVERNGDFVNMRYSVRR